MTIAILLSQLMEKTYPYGRSIVVMILEILMKSLLNLMKRLGKIKSSPLIILTLLLMTMISYCKTNMVTM